MSDHDCVCLGDKRQLKKAVEIEISDDESDVIMAPAPITKPTPITKPKPVLNTKPKPASTPMQIVCIEDDDVVPVTPVAKAPAPAKVTPVTKAAPPVAKAAVFIPSRFAPDVPVNVLTPRRVAPVTQANVLTPRRAAAIATPVTVEPEIGQTPAIPPKPVDALIEIAKEAEKRREEPTKKRKGKEDEEPVDPTPAADAPSKPSPRFSLDVPKEDSSFCCVLPKPDTKRPHKESEIEWTGLPETAMKEKKKKPAAKADLPALEKLPDNCDFADALYLSKRTRYCRNGRLFSGPYKGTEGAVAEGGYKLIELLQKGRPDVQVLLPNGFFRSAKGSEKYAEFQCMACKPQNEWVITEKGGFAHVSRESMGILTHPRSISDDFMQVYIGLLWATLLKANTRDFSNALLIDSQVWLEIEAGTKGESIGSQPHLMVFTCEPSEELEEKLLAWYNAHATEIGSEVERIGELMGVLDSDDIEIDQLSGPFWDIVDQYGMKREEIYTIYGLIYDAVLPSDDQ